MGAHSDEEPGKEVIRKHGGPGPRLRGKGRLKAKFLVGTHKGSNTRLGEM